MHAFINAIQWPTFGQNVYSIRRLLTTTNRQHHHHHQDRRDADRTHLYNRMAVDVAHASEAHRANQAHRDAMVSMVSMDRLDSWDRQDRRRRTHPIRAHSFPNSARAKRPLVNLVRKVILVSKDRRARLAKMVKMANPAIKEQEAHQEIQANQDKLADLDPPDHPARYARCQDLWVDQERQADQANLDNPVRAVTMVKMVLLDLSVNQVPRVPMVHLDKTDRKDPPDLQENPEHRAAAITAHRRVWHPDTRAERGCNRHHSSTHRHYN